MLLTKPTRSANFGCGFLPFPGPDADALIYLDGNSLGRPPISALDAVTELIAADWAAGVGSWGATSRSGRPAWIELPTIVGDLLGATLLGADGRGRCSSATRRRSTSTSSLPPLSTPDPIGT